MCLVVTLMSSRFECPERYEAITSYLNDTGLISVCALHDPPCCDADAILSCHTMDHLERIKSFRFTDESLSQVLLRLLLFSIFQTPLFHISINVNRGCQILHFPMTQRLLTISPLRIDSF